MVRRFDFKYEKKKIKCDELIKEKRKLEKKLLVENRKVKKLEAGYHSKNCFMRLNLKVRLINELEYITLFVFLMWFLSFIRMLSYTNFKTIFFGIIVVSVLIIIFELIYDRKNPLFLNKMILNEIKSRNWKIDSIQEELEYIYDEINNILTYIYTKKGKSHDSRNEDW